MLKSNENQSIFNLFQPFQFNFWIISIKNVNLKMKEHLLFLSFAILNNLVRLTAQKGTVSRKKLCKLRLQVMLSLCQFLLHRYGTNFLRDPQFIRFFFPQKRAKISRHGPFKKFQFKKPSRGAYSNAMYVNDIERSSMSKNSPKDD